MSENSDLFGQGDIFQTPPVDAKAYPLNAGGQEPASRFIRQDIRESNNYLIITGYSSLAYLIEELGKPKLNARNCVEVVLGNEPLALASVASGGVLGNRQPVYSSTRALRLPDEIRQFWLAQGISVLLNGPVLNMIEKIKFGKVSFFYHTNLHAKVYKGDGAVMLGSSNFSAAGMGAQKEANVRKEFGEEGFTEIGSIATYYRQLAHEWNEEMIGLLEELLREMSWQETLARAVALILEGSWIEKYPDAWRLNRSSRLWPTQRKGIAQALYLLERQGSVLIADPTGSGKTRMGAKLLEALLNKLWIQLKPHRSRYMIVCPPLVREGWRQELRHLDWNTSDPVSHGLLSNPEHRASAEALENVKRAHILLIDEAHNYLNKNSIRSRSVVVNRADHIILFTATPINRRSDDLLRLVEILGLDNLDDEAYKTYKELLGSKDSRSPEKMDQLRRYVNRFMVRRTKKELNEAVDQEPDEFTDVMGNKCRYPVSRARLYKTGETTADKEIAAQIEELIQHLKGIIYISNLTADSYDRQTPEREQAFLKKRLSMGAALTRYNIRNMLRSSRAALVEHLAGTTEAMREFGIDSFKQSDTGNIIERVETLMRDLPATNLKIELPDFLTQKEVWEETCRAEIEALRQIQHLATKMSQAREEGKASQIIKMIDKHGMLLVYDTALITLTLMQQLLAEKGYDDKAMVVTGSTGKTKKMLTSGFALEAEKAEMAALCSDALSEGVNLQRASAVLFLDMPSVIRIAEQRIGRVERMDSPHKEVFVYWPDDSEEFRLKTDRNFYQRHQMVESLIGSNITLPEELMERSDEFEEESLTTEQVIAAFDDHQEKDRSWEGFEDAFSSLRGLVSGKKAMVDEPLYDEVKRMNQTTGTWISVVKSPVPFTFLALEGSDSSAPSWLLRIGDEKPIAEINQIAAWFQKNLRNAEQDDFNDAAEKQLREAVHWLNRHEQEMLPNKKQNALNQIQKVLPQWLKNAESLKIDDETLGYMKKLSDLIKTKPGASEPVPDWYELANRWLDITQPVLIYWLENERRNRKYQNIRLQDINGYLKKHPHGLRELKHLLDELPIIEPAEKRIIAVIIGNGAI